MTTSYISPKSKVKKSKIHGRGLFAIRPIQKGEIVAIIGGHIMNERELQKSDALPEVSYFQIENGFYIGAKEKSEVKKNKRFLNHSCEPNVGFHGQITFVAMRNIKKGEELTYDWAM
jgi:SET domain-containing protein